jgi:uncharacterized protein with HEPN domain
MKRDRETYLIDLRESCEHITSFIGTMSSDEYNGNLLVRRAVEREFEIIGEILRRIRDEMPELFQKIPSASEIIGFRNVIAHGYDVVSDNTVYEIAKADIPELYKILHKL